MSVLSETLSRYLNWFQNHFPLEASYLQPGLTVKEIAEKVKALPFELPQEVYELYQWKNGAVSEACFPLDGWMEFLPLEEALELYNAVSDLIEIGLWNRNFFPLFTLDNTNIGCWVAECHKEPKEKAVIINYDTENGADDTSLYASLTSMMLTIVECYEMGAYSIDSNGYFKENPQKAGQIWRKYNTELAESALKRLQGELSLESITEAAPILMQSLDLAALDILIEALQISTPKLDEIDKNMQIRAIAAQILGELKDPKAVEPLIRALNDAYWLVRNNAAIALGQIGDNRAVEALINTLEDREQQVRGMASLALRRLKVKPIERLIQALKSESARIREGAAWALGEIKDSRAIEPLSQLLQDEDSSVRAAAQRALSNIQVYLKKHQ